MGGSDAATTEARDDAQVVVVVGSPVADSASDPLAAPAPLPPAPEAAEAEAKRELPAAAPAEAVAVEGKQDAAAATAAGVQAMAVTLVRDVETGPEASTSGAAEEKPSWFTPKRYYCFH
jgi:hypothetical protein